MSDLLFGLLALVLKTVSAHNFTSLHGMCGVHIPISLAAEGGELQILCIVYPVPCEWLSTRRRLSGGMQKMDRSIICKTNLESRIDWCWICNVFLRVAF